MQLIKLLTHQYHWVRSFVYALIKSKLEVVIDEFDIFSLTIMFRYETRIFNIYSFLFTESSGPLDRGKDTQYYRIQQYQIINREPGCKRLDIARGPQGEHLLGEAMIEIQLGREEELIQWIKDYETRTTTNT